MLSKVVSSSIFKVFGMTRPGIEPRSPGPLANTLTAGPMSRFIWLYRYSKSGAVMFSSSQYKPNQFSTKSVANICSITRNLRLKIIWTNFPLMNKQGFQEIIISNIDSQNLLIWKHVANRENTLHRIYKTGFYLSSPSPL